MILADVINVTLLRCTSWLSVISGSRSSAPDNISNVYVFGHCEKHLLLATATMVTQNDIDRTHPLLATDLFGQNKTKCPHQT